MLSCLLAWSPVFWLFLSSHTDFPVVDDVDRDFSSLSGKEETLLRDRAFGLRVLPRQREEQAGQYV